MENDISIGTKLFSQFSPWSYSRINTLKNCPLSFYKRYVKKEKGTSAVHAKTALGKIAHELLEHGIARGEKKVPESIITRVKDKHSIEGDSLDKFVENANTVIQKLDDFEKNVEKIESIGVEQQLKTGEYYGVVDLIIETPSKVMIVDHKTTQSKPTIYWYKEQLYMYGALYSRITKSNKPILHGINFSYHNEIIWDTQARDPNYLNAVLDRMEKETKIRLRDNYEKHGLDNEWDANINNLCAYCSYRDECTKYQNT